MTPDTPAGRDPVNDPLDEALRSLGQQGSGMDAARRDAAWARVQARLHDPARAVFTDDGPVELGVGSMGYGVQSLELGVRSGTLGAPRRAGWLMAAVLVLSLGGLGAWGATPVRYEVARGASAGSVSLPDGSTVTVAAGGSVTYDRRVAWPGPLRAAERRVHVKGTAFFDVARDGRVFRVQTSDASVQVLGTRFEVRAAEGEFGSRVQVEEGRVAVSGAKSRLELAAGEGAVVTATGLRLRPAASRGVATWRTGGLAALDEPVGAVLAELARRYALEISADPAVDVQSTVSLFYPVAPSAEVVLGDLCTAQGLTFERTSRGFRVRGPVRAP